MTVSRLGRLLSTLGMEELERAKRPHSVSTISATHISSKSKAAPIQKSINLPKHFYKIRWRQRTCIVDAHWSPRSGTHLPNLQILTRTARLYFQCNDCQLKSGIIWEYVELRTAAGAFTIVTGETLRLANSVNWPDCRHILLDPGSQISLKMISVFGTSYIQAFEHGDITKTITCVVDRLSFVIALGGICAIKLLGTSWDSGWLGKILTTGPLWYGTILEIGSGLTCSFNVCSHLL